MERLERESSCREHRCSLVLPQEQFDALREVSTERGVTVVNLIRKFVKLGLFVDGSLERGGKLFKRKAGKEDVELIIL